MAGTAKRSPCGVSASTSPTTGRPGGPGSLAGSTPIAAGELSAPLGTITRAFARSTLPPSGPMVRPGSGASVAASGGRSAGGAGRGQPLVESASATAARRAEIIRAVYRAAARRRHRPNGRGQRSRGAREASKRLAMRRGRARRRRPLDCAPSALVVLRRRGPVIWTSSTLEHPAQRPRAPPRRPAHMACHASHEHRRTHRAQAMSGLRVTSAGKRPKSRSAVHSSRTPWIRQRAAIRASCTRGPETFAARRTSVSAGQ